MTSFLRSDRSRPVAVWLLAVAVLVLAMVMVGGATRLTGSGLSITEWKPVTGALPPMGEEAWGNEFAKYQKIPQYQQVNRGMTLAQFKSIYGWEWAHRLLARLVVAAFAIPLVVFLVRRQIPRRLIWRCAGMFGLLAMQAVVGWWMVASGLAGRVSVAPERPGAGAVRAAGLDGARRRCRPVAPGQPDALAGRVADLPRRGLCAKPARRAGRRGARRFHLQ
jgi:cytochrome c oxidase assembly protein subunit 15